MCPSVRPSETWGAWGPGLLTKSLTRQGPAQYCGSVQQLQRWGRVSRDMSEMQERADRVHSLASA